MGCTQSSTSDPQDVTMVEACDTSQMDVDLGAVPPVRLRLLDLPLEMIVEVLTHVDTPRDLHNFLQASKSIYTAFKLRERVIRWSVLRNAFPGMNYHDAVYAVKADCMRRAMLEGRDTYDKRWVSPAEAGRIKVKWKAEAKAFLDGYHALTMTSSPYFTIRDACLNPQDHTATDPLFKLWYLVDHFVTRCAGECRSDFRDQLITLSEKEQRQRVEWQKACETEAAKREAGPGCDMANIIQGTVYESRLIASEPSQGLTCHFEQTADGPQLVIHQETSSDAGSQTSDVAQSPFTSVAASTTSSSDTQQSRASTPATATPPKYDPLPDAAVITSVFARSLSRHEYIRIQRAFLRLEIHRRTLPLAATTSYVFSHRFQGCRFFGGFTPWEREEMLCVHKFLRRYTRRMLNTIRNNVVTDLQNYLTDKMPLLSSMKPTGTEDEPQPHLINFSNDVLRDVGWSSLVGIGTGMYAPSETEIQRLPLLGLPFLRLLETSELRRQRDLLNDHGFWRRHWHRHILLPSALIKSNAHDTHPSAISNSRRHARRSAEGSSEEKAMALSSAGWRWSRPSKLEQMAKELKRTREDRHKQESSSFDIFERPKSLVPTLPSDSTQSETSHVTTSARITTTEHTTISLGAAVNNASVSMISQVPESPSTAVTLTIPIHSQTQESLSGETTALMTQGASDPPQVASTSNPPAHTTGSGFTAATTSVSSPAHTVTSTTGGESSTAGVDSATAILTTPANTDDANGTASASTSPETPAECRKRNECARTIDSKLWPLGYVFWGKKRLAEAGVLERDVQDLVADIGDSEAIEVQSFAAQVERSRNLKIHKNVLDALKPTGDDVVIASAPMRTLEIVEACEY